MENTVSQVDMDPDGTDKPVTSPTAADAPTSPGGSEKKTYTRLDDVSEAAIGTFKAKKKLMESLPDKDKADKAKSDKAAKKAVAVAAAAPAGPSFIQIPDVVSDILWRVKTYVELPGLIVAAVIGTWILAWLGSSFWLVAIFATGLVVVFKRRTQRFLYLLEQRMTRDVARGRLETHIETTEWLNHIIERFWGVFEPMLAEQVLAGVNEALEAQCPAFLSSLALTTFTLGSEPPALLGARVHPQTDSDVLHLDLEAVFVPRQQLVDERPPIPGQPGARTTFQRNSEICLTARLGTSMMGMGVDIPVLIEGICVHVKPRIQVKLMSAMPLVKSVAVMLAEAPRVDFVLKPLKALDLMDMPGLSAWLKTTIEGTAAALLVAPNAITIDVDAMLNQAASAREKSIGLVKIAVYGAAIPKSNEYMGIVDPYVTVELGGRPVARTHTILDAPHPTWNEVYYVLVQDTAAVLAFRLFHYNNLSKDRQLGLAELPLATLEAAANREGLPRWLSLRDEEEDEAASSKKKPQPRGDLQVAVSYYPATPVPTTGLLEEYTSGILNVTLHQLKDLAPKGSGGASAKTYSPYVELFLAKAAPSSEKTANLASLSVEALSTEPLLRTKTKKRNNSPVYEAKVEVFAPDIGAEYVWLQVKEARELGGPALLGDLVVPLADLIRNNLSVTEPAEGPGGGGGAAPPKDGGQDWYQLRNVDGGRVRLTCAFDGLECVVEDKLALPYVPSLGVVRLHLLQLGRWRLGEPGGLSDGDKLYLVATLPGQPTSAQPLLRTPVMELDNRDTPLILAPSAVTGAAAAGLKALGDTLRLELFEAKSFGTDRLVASAELDPVRDTAGSGGRLEALWLPFRNKKGVTLAEMQLDLFFHPILQAAPLPGAEEEKEANEPSVKKGEGAEEPEDKEEEVVVEEKSELQSVHEAFGWSSQTDVEGLIKTSKLHLAVVKVHQAKLLQPTTDAEEVTTGDASSPAIQAATKSLPPISWKQALAGTAMKGASLALQAVFVSDVCVPGVAAGAEPLRTLAETKAIPLKAALRSSGGSTSLSWADETIEGVLHDAHLAEQGRTESGGLMLQLVDASQNVVARAMLRWADVERDPKRAIWMATKLPVRMALVDAASAKLPPALSLQQQDALSKGAPAIELTVTLQLLPLALLDETPLPGHLLSVEGQDASTAWPMMAFLGMMPAQVLGGLLERAVGLLAVDSGGTSDPFVSVRLDGRKLLAKSKAVKKTVAPVWNEVFRESPLGTLTALHSVLSVEVRDWNAINSSEFLGQATLRLVDILAGKHAQTSEDVDASMAALAGHKQRGSSASLSGKKSISAAASASQQHAFALMIEMEGTTQRMLSKKEAKREAKEKKTVAAVESSSMATTSSSSVNLVEAATEETSKLAAYASTSTFTHKPAGRLFLTLDVAGLGQPLPPELMPPSRGDASTNLAMATLGGIGSVGLGAASMVGNVGLGAVNVVGNVGGKTIGLAGSTVKGGFSLAKKGTKTLLFMGGSSDKHKKDGSSELAEEEEGGEAGSVASVAAGLPSEARFEVALVELLALPDCKLVKDGLDVSVRVKQLPPLASAPKPVSLLKGKSHRFVSPRLALATLDGPAERTARLGLPVAKLQDSERSLAPTMPVLALDVRHPKMFSEETLARFALPLSVLRDLFKAEGAEGGTTSTTVWLEALSDAAAASGSGSMSQEFGPAAAASVVHVDAPVPGKTTPSVSGHGLYLGLSLACKYAGGTSGGASAASIDDEDAASSLLTSPQPEPNAGKSRRKSIFFNQS